MCCSRVYSISWKDIVEGSGKMVLRWYLFYAQRNGTVNPRARANASYFQPSVGDSATFSGSSGAQWRWHGAVRASLARRSPLWPLSRSCQANLATGMSGPRIGGTGHATLNAPPGHRDRQVSKIRCVRPDPRALPRRANASCFRHLWAYRSECVAARSVAVAAHAQVGCSGRAMGLVRSATTPWVR